MRTLVFLLLLLNLTISLATPSGDAQDSTQNADQSGQDQGVVPEPTAPTVARDVGVADLPLLVDEPPQEGESPDIPDPVIGGADSSFNPFAPLVLPQQPSEAAPPTATETPEATEPAPSTPPTETQTAPAPAAPAFPAAPAPEARVSRPGIPSALTNRMTPPGVTQRAAPPGILEAAIGTRTSSLSDVSGTSVAVRTPALPPLIAAPAMVGASPNVARPVASRAGTPQGITPMTFAGTMLGYDENATSAVSNRVSRSLSTLRVSFTAMSTGTGIFRVGDSPRPILLVVGDTLPGTQLTLSSLTARSAQFVEDDVRHTLLLNP